jgi:hypothetical protein
VRNEGRISAPYIGSRWTVLEVGRGRTESGAMWVPERGPIPAMWGGRTSCPPSGVAGLARQAQTDGRRISLRITI